MDMGGLLAAVRQVLAPVNVVMALLFAAGVALLAVGVLQVAWPEQEPAVAPAPAQPEPEDADRTY